MHFESSETFLDAHDDFSSATESLLPSLDDTAGFDPLTDLSRIVPQVPAMVYTYTIDRESGESSFPYVSDYCENMFGLPASDIVEDPENFVNLVHPADVNTFTASVLESMTNLSQWDHQMLMFTKSGRTIHIHGRSTPHNYRKTNPDGSVAHLTVWHGVLFEITSQQSNNEERCKDVHEPSFFMEDGQITEWSDSMADITGMNRNNVLGNNLALLVDNSNEATVDTVHLALSFTRNLQSGGDHTYSGDLTFLSKSGCKVRLYTTFQQRNDESTKKVGINCTCKDVTTLRQAEEGKKAALQLLDAEKNLTDWLSHEIRNPLSIAMESSQALKDLYTDRDSFSTHSSIEQNKIADKEGLYFVQLVLSSVAYVVDILTNTLDLNKCVDGKITLRPAICSLNKDIIEPIQEMMGACGSRVLISISGEDVQIFIDKLRLKQVLMNLITNATKSTSKGFIHVATKKINHDVDGNIIEDSLIITVSDSGSGISEQEYPKLFTKWQQLGSAGNGAGIGLYLSSLLIKAMGAHIYLNKSYNSGIEGHPGSQFVVRFPLNTLLATDHEGNAMHSVSAFSAISLAVVASTCSNNDPLDLKQDFEEEVPTSLMSRDVEARSYINGKFKLLVVDDDKVLRKILRKRFSLIFPQAIIDEAENGETALDYVQQDHRSYDIIFMDQYMSADGMTGDETIRKMREKNIDSLIIGISGNLKADEHIAAGAQDFFQKPIPCNKTILKRLLMLLPPPRGWKVLIVDASLVNCQLLKRKLFKVASGYFTKLEIAEEHWSISVCTIGAAAMPLLQKEWFDLLVLDDCHLDSNGITNFDIAECSKKQSMNPNAITVISSSSRDQEKSRFIDIYWQKPFPSVEKMRLDLCQKLVNTRPRL